MTTPWNRPRAALLAALIVMGATAAAQAQPVTGVRGQVTDAETGEPLIEAVVRVVQEPKASARTAGEGATATDLDGMYELPLPPGTYELRVSYDVYQARRIRGVVVRRTGATRLDVKLKPDPGAVEEVVVEARADIRTEAAGLQERKRSATVQDAVSAQEISRSPDSSAGDAVKRVVSATVVGGRYVFVRGLGGRYSTTLLNGVVLPSPDPDATAVPLDIFPASLLANLTVVKTYTPDLPGQFAGGTLIIETNTYPSDFEMKFKLSSSIDSESAFRRRYTYVGGSYDYLGFDSGRRALPESAPDDRPLVQGEPGIDAPTVERIAEDFADIWNLEKRTAMPNIGMSGQIGDTLRLGGGRLGYMATVSYGHKEQVQEGMVGVTKAEMGNLVYRQRLNTEVGVESVSWGALAAAGWEPSPKHSLRSVVLFTHSMEDRAQEVDGISESEGTELIRAWRLQFVTRRLTFGQLTGDHHFSRFRLDWQGNLSFVNRYEPDTRDFSQIILEDGRARFQSEPGSGERFFSTLDDVQGGAGFTVSVPFQDLMELKAGAIGHITNRDFNARRFRFEKIAGGVEVLTLDPEEMLSPTYIGPNFRLAERTLQQDAYTARQQLTGGFVMADVSRFDPFRLIGGVRYEVLAQELTPGSVFAITDLAPDPIDRTDAHILPALNAVYALTPNMNLRAGYSYTIARPALREVAPFLFFDFVRRKAVSGNEDLEDTRIHNADARWEMFPSERSVLAASVFYKLFRDPIEVTMVPGTDSITYENAFGARALGLELEARGTLGRFSRSLRDVRLAGNLTLVDSEIDLGGEMGFQTNRFRPLQGQSPYVINLDAGWSTKKGEISVLYNVSGPRIVEVGVEGNPDIYEQPFHRLDASAAMSMGSGFKLKLGATNLLNQPVVLKQGDLVVQKYKPGFAAIVSLEWSP
jgi:outer membrane receptor protein involved in Fe transport